MYSQTFEKSMELYNHSPFNKLIVYLNINNTIQSEFATKFKGMK